MVALAVPPSRLYGLCGRDACTATVAGTACSKPRRPSGDGLPTQGSRKPALISHDPPTGLALAGDLRAFHDEPYEERLGLAFRGEGDGERLDHNVALVLGRLALGIVEADVGLIAQSQ